MLDVLADFNPAEVKTTDYKAPYVPSRPEISFTTRKTNFDGWTARVNTPSRSTKAQPVKFPDVYFHGVFHYKSEHKFILVYVSNHKLIVGPDGKIDKVKLGVPVYCLMHGMTPNKDRFGRPLTPREEWEQQATQQWVKWKPYDAKTAAKYDSDITGTLVLAQKDSSKRDAVASRTNPAHANHGPDADGEVPGDGGNDNDIPF